MSPRASGGFVNFHKSSLGFRGHLITNFPNVMVLLIIILKYLTKIKNGTSKNKQINLPAYLL